MDDVLVGCVTSPKDHAVAERFHACLRNLDPKPAKIVFAEISGDTNYRDWLAQAGWSVIPVDISKYPSPHAAGRDAILHEALKGDFTHALFLEGNVLPPPNTLALLLEDPKKVMAGVYLGPVEYGKRTLVAPVLATIRKSPQYGHLVPLNLVMPPKRLEVGGVGFGCVLLSREILEKIDLSDTRTSFDASHKIRQAGFLLFADTRVKCIQVYAGKDMVFPVDLVGFQFKTEV